MEALQLKVALRILGHAGIPTCLVGELALNYYNVPRVLHDIEICVPENMVLKAASLLRGTGLFEPDEIEEFDLYNEYKRGCPRLRSSSWISPSSALVILGDKIYGLNPISKNVLSRDKVPSNPSYSSQIMDLIPPAEINQLPIPRLPVLLVGLCRRFLESHDDVAMIAAEQLVDGMDLDDGWCDRNLSGVSSAVLEMSSRLVAGKTSRLDDFSENTITCFIANEDEVERVRRIPGYE
ncbi:uncharacterized protein LY89DRAFT_735167 [Mollisia scopiformis]|uniref:Uncharacterized protein n=1 Tax=Mollisia scopiformis TaxID=149040 RepID=A0A194X774_MOLSC|nr:uncharacterized protein LY89DRAFT_735167 [Mollisia scopiformis]KUJ16023.1 hypothetical protein LY89DRAFT_735167 [Mollisia scopiformis]